MSTRLAMKGVELTAGSSPTRSSKIGSIEPTTVPRVTTATKVTATVAATPGPSPQIMARATPMIASIRPSVSPIASSRESTRPACERLTSPTARARMMSVADCDPELPPDEMISGRKMTRTVACLITSSK